MDKKIYYEEDARSRVLAGAKEVYEAVRVTMGPKGRNVVIQKPYHTPSVTHDGVTVARSVVIKDDPKNDGTLGKSVGADLIKGAASKTADNVGDGTTTSTVLAYHILNEANKLIATGYNPMDLKRGLDEATGHVLAAITGLSESIKGNRAKIAQVATISAGDAKIGELIADVIETVGEDGTVAVEQSRALWLEKEIVKGFKFDRGYISSYMATDTNRMEASYENVTVIITDKKLSSADDIIPMFDQIAQTGQKNVLIVADDIDGDALALIILNKLKGTFNVLGVKAPAFGERRKVVLEDMATLTGATVIGDGSGLTLSTASLEALGRARKVITTKDSTTIIEGAGSPEDVQIRMDDLRQMAVKATDEYEKAVLAERQAALGGKVAIIRVGGYTDTEISEKKDRVDDAVAATKAAVAEGIVAGGGVTLVNLSNALVVNAEGVLESHNAGARILKQALLQPFRQLMENAGLNPDELLPLVNKAPDGKGFNVNDSTKLIDMKKSGIVDPTKVTREAVQNAVSIAGTAMTMGALVVDLTPDNPQAQIGMPQ